MFLSCSPSFFFFFSSWYQFPQSPLLPLALRIYSCFLLMPFHSTPHFYLPLLQLLTRSLHTKYHIPLPLLHGIYSTDLRIYTYIHCTSFLFGVGGWVGGVGRVMDGRWGKSNLYFTTYCMYVLLDVWNDFCIALLRLLICVGKSKFANNKGIEQ